MDPTTLLGIILGFALIVNGIGFDKIGNFINVPSMVIVIGGALSATLSSYPLGILKDIPKHFAVLVRGKRYDIPKLVEQLVDLGTIARQSGLLALEDKAAEIKDPFFKQSVLMIVDANDPDKVRLVLERELDNMMVRHDQAAGLYEKAASYAPSFGMIGTLIEPLVSPRYELSWSDQHAERNEYGCRWFFKYRKRHVSSIDHNLLWMYSCKCYF